MKHKLSKLFHTAGGKGNHILTFTHALMATRSGAVYNPCQVVTSDDGLPCSGAVAMDERLDPTDRSPMCPLNFCACVECAVCYRRGHRNYILYDQLFNWSTGMRDGPWTGGHCQDCDTMEQTRGVQALQRTRQAQIQRRFIEMLNSASFTGFQRGSMTLEVLLTDGAVFSG